MNVPELMYALKIRLVTISRAHTTALAILVIKDELHFAPISMNVLTTLTTAAPTPTASTQRAALAVLARTDLQATV